METAAQNGTAEDTPKIETPVVVEEVKEVVPEEITKRSLRVQTWKKIQENRMSAFPSVIFNRIPNFIGAEKAAELLTETQEFKDSTNIKVNVDRSQEPVKYQVVSNKKILYVPAARDSSALFSKINVPEDADETVLKKVIRINTLTEFGSDIEASTDMKLDMLVIGSVAVSRDGYRIGRGNGYVDLDFGILVQLGVVTEKTIIVTTVHDLQVYDTLPLNLFENYDVPIDMIVTPTEVIRVTKRLPRPTGIQWNLLSERRLGIVPVLKVIKETDEKAGKKIELKSDDTDVETNRKNFPKQRKMIRRRRRPRHSDKEGQNGDTEAEGENTESTNSKPRRKPERRFRRGDRGGDNERTSNDKENASSGNRMRARRENRDYCVKISNIARNIRIKDLKAELRNRGVNPMFISWKGAYGKCYLHFGKRPEVDSEAAITEMLESLSNLSLTVQKGDSTKDVELRVELIKRPVAATESRIETTDVTSV